MATEPSPELVKEHLGTLSRGFPRRDPEEFIVLDGFMLRGNRYLADCTNWLLEQKYISHDAQKSEELSGSQYTAMCYRLTDSGRNAIQPSDAVLNFPRPGGAK